MSRYKKEQIAKMVIDPNTTDMLETYPRLKDILPKGSFVKRKPNIVNNGKLGP